MNIKGILICSIFTGSLLVGCKADKSMLYRHKLADINHIIHMGQSLAAGDESLPCVSVNDSGWGNYRFAVGTHTWSAQEWADRPELRDDTLFSLAPLTAQRRGREGETIANGMCDHLRSTITAGRLKNARFLFSFAGQGGRYLRELDKIHDDAKDPRAGNRRSPGGYYRTSVDDVKRGLKTARTMQKTYSVLAVTWMQGEANISGKMNRWDPEKSPGEAVDIYKNDLIQLKEDYQRDIREITKQPDPIPFFTYQTAGNIAGKAQLLACAQEKDMFLVSPVYMLPNAENGSYESGGKRLHGDGIHLTADGERWLGEMFGKATRKVVAEGRDWDPVRPLYAASGDRGKSVYIRFHVPVPPLVMDTSFLPAQGKALGFEVNAQSGQPVKVKSAEVVGKDVVKLVLDEALPSGTTHYVRYGWNTFVEEVSAVIRDVRYSEAENSGFAPVDVVFNGNILEEFRVLTDEGVFYLNNRVPEKAARTHLIVRSVRLDENNDTVLRGYVKDLRDGVPFLPGQACYTSRRYAFGNVRDSDPEESTFSFSDDSYGRRAGKRYPLFNWCVVFSDLEVKTD